MATRWFILCLLRGNCLDRGGRLSFDKQMAAHHVIDYIEISVLDMQEARDFYSRAFGWAYNDYGPDYSGIEGPSGEVGGFCKVDSVDSGGPLVVIYSEDLESSQSSVEEAGGVVCRKIFTFPGGRRFQFKDPSGNELAVWSRTTK